MPFRSAALKFSLHNSPPVATDFICPLGSFYTFMSACLSPAGSEKPDSPINKEFFDRLQVLVLPVLQQVCHRDLKLENALIDGSPAPRLKICDFGYSKSSVLHSQPKSTVGTPAYIAPEVLSTQEYDGKIADVWSCGVTLYVMLVGGYPFEDPNEPRDFRKTIHRILNVQYSIPENIEISPECRHLISKIFVGDPAQRITMAEIRTHEWFVKNMPADLMDEEKMTNNQFEEADQPMQSVDAIMKIISEATIPSVGVYDLDLMEDDFDLDLDIHDFDSDNEELYIDSSGEIVYAL
ncbi:hypothetical protein E3N88_30157 [Mikania micrantha]|uniref:non-specific serine/threonine protein kinase n=1 Tax=Mikania micrantha TaxID=192012 RepID=A0A5N6MNQ2_9ASTR|nr:hypothetical protein E3N88_30157 [Mikania micrantha]